MRLSQRFKSLGALLLLASLALPIAKSCSAGFQDAQGKPVFPAADGTLPAGVRPSPIKNVYAFDKVHGIRDVLLMLLLFSWPVIPLGVLYWKPKGWIAFVTRILEPVLVATSGGFIEFIATFFTGGRAIGAYTAFAALAAYAVGAIWQDVVVFRNWRAER
jgi:hypothetical protein